MLRLVPVLAEALRDVDCEVPAKLRAEGAPKRVRYQNRRCTECGWEGHEGQMIREQTVLGDGTYPAGCPSCRASNRFLGRTLVEIVDGYTVLTALASTGSEHNE